ncbi:hypothetical protein [Archangium sp.]|nr:hypothetical protein [Archangium sp.]
MERGFAPLHIGTRSACPLHPGDVMVERRSRGQYDNLLIRLSP